MDPSLATDVALAHARDLKEWVVRTRGYRADMLSMLVLWHEGVLLGACDIASTPSPVRYPLVAEAVAMVDADLVQIVADSYTRRATLEEAEADPAWYQAFDHGDLEQAARRGDPRVVEALSVVTWQAASPATPELRLLRYEWDGPRPRWLEPERCTGVQLGGGFAEAVELGFASRAGRPFPAQPLAVVAQATGFDVVEIVFAAPPRNGPCPCGSGEKAKYCCWGAA